MGYVIEAPIWKTSYRLLMAEKEKPYLQGWAMVENPTDEDWSGVKMALVSGRPISFKMDLYNPLYINRPTVEPELFASLRPVTYSGGFKSDDRFANRKPGQGGEQVEKLDKAMKKEAENQFRQGGRGEGRQQPALRRDRRHRSPRRSGTGQADRNRYCG